MTATVLRLAEQPLRYDVSQTVGTWLGEPPPEPLNESELSWIWAGQRYPPGALSLVDGRSLRVLNPGRHGGGAGPDFLDAVLEIDGLTVRGDVELHVRSSGFRAHGHETDPAYDRVALHVVFRADEGACTRLSNGSEAPVAAFAPWFDNRRDELQRWLSADALWQEPCQNAVYRLGPDGIRATLREAGLERFRAKASALRQAVSEAGEHEAVWRGLFDVMGVGGDREGFRRLAVVLPGALAARVLNEDRAPDGLLAALSYAAGLHPGAPPGEGLPPPLRAALAASGRPANRPQRRLAGIATLFERAGGDLPAMCRRTVRDAASAKALVTAWQVSQDGVALIGPDRAREVVLNLVLPFAALDAAPERAEALLEGLGASPAYGTTTFLERNLRGADGKRAVRGALEQQGLLGMLRQWCSRGGCGQCPLS